MDYAQKLTRTRIRFRPTMKWIHLIFFTSVSLAMCALSDDLAKGSFEIVDIVLSLLFAPIYPVFVFIITKRQGVKAGISSVQLNDEVGKIKWSEIKRMFFLNLLIFLVIFFIVIAFDSSEFTWGAIVRTIIFSFYSSISQTKILKL